MLVSSDSGYSSGGSAGESFEWLRAARETSFESAACGDTSGGSAARQHDTASNHASAAEFRQMWHEQKVPDEVDLPRELEQGE